VIPYASSGYTYSSYYNGGYPRYYGPAISVGFGFGVGGYYGGYRGGFYGGGHPGGSGLTVLQRYSDCASLARTPVVVLTGRDPMALEGDVRKFGVAGFLIKPAENDQLLGVIERALRGEPDPGASRRRSPETSSRS
jgi:hypothetical protein